MVATSLFMESAINDPVLNMEQVLCRTCLDLTDKTKCKEIRKPCCLDKTTEEYKTVKDVIIMLVPQMVFNIFGDDYVCGNCLRTLKASFKFIERCLEVERLNAEKEARENQNDVDEFSENEAKNTDLEEDVIILLDNDSQQAGIDHNYYIKIEPDDYDDVNSENEVETNKNDAPENYSVPIEIVPEKPMQKNKDLDIKNDTSKSPEFMFYDSLSLYDETQNVDSDNVNLEGNLSQESLSGGEDLDTKNSQSTSLIPPKNDKLRCVICSKKFTCRSDYDRHLDIHPPFICDYCGKGYKTNSTLKCHARYHKEKYHALCEFCGKPFRGMSNLNLHISGVHANENKYICDRCPKRFTNKFRLGLHRRVVHEKARQQQCFECGEFFRDLEACKSHYRLIHLELKPFVCHVCGEEFGRKDYLKKHMYLDNHTDNPKLTKNKTLPRTPTFGIRLKNSGKPVDCKVCGKKMSSVYSLKAHLQTHVKIKRHKCQFCDLTFTLVGNRNRHQRLHDSDPENKFRCNICWKRVKTKEVLEMHVKGHYIGRPPQYSCDMCGEKFHRRYLLDNHLLDEHTGPEDIRKAEEEIIIKNLLEYAHPSSLCNV